MAKKPSSYPPVKTGPAAALREEAQPGGRPSALLDILDEVKLGMKLA